MREFICVVFAAFLSLSYPSKAESTIADFFQESDAFFEKRVLEGKVNYTAIQQNFEEIEALYGQINHMDLSTASDAEKKAFYINAYNLTVIYQIAKYYPLKSPMDQSGFFDKVKHQIAGESMTLNYLEIKKIIIPYQDPRIHFALACAAKGCPKLANFSYTPDNLDQQLTARTRLALNDPAFTRVNNTQKKVEISKIFEWYKKDFTKGGMSLLSFINQYRDEPIPTHYAIAFYEYDWQLNDARD